MAYHPICNWMNPTYTKRNGGYQALTGTSRHEFFNMATGTRFDRAIFLVGKTVWDLMVPS